MRSIEIRGMEHPSAHDALVELNFTGDRAISIAGRYFTVSEDEYCRLENAGIQPTTWHDLGGRIVSVPGKH